MTALGNGQADSVMEREFAKLADAGKFAIAAGVDPRGVIDLVVGAALSTIGEQNAIIAAAYDVLLAMLCSDFVRVGGPMEPLGGRASAVVSQIEKWRRKCDLEARSTA